jgi:hypothetical protein
MHRFDAVSFGFGILFMATAAYAAFRDVLPLDARWVFPAAFLILGAGLLVSLVVDHERGES